METINPTHYATSYEVFQETIQRRRRDQEWARNVFPRAVVDLLRTSRAKTRQGVHEDSTFRTLGIGPGTGEFEMHLLRELVTHFPRIDHVVIEPSHALVCQYQSAFKAAPSTLTPGVTIEWRRETLEDFRKYQLLQSVRHGHGNCDVTTADEGTSASGFDFITASHCMYYVSDADEAVRFLYDSLAPGGVLMIEMSTDDTGTEVRMFSKFPEIPRSSDKGWVKLSDVKRALTDADIPFTTVVRHLLLDITSAFDPTSDDGDLLLDFLTHVTKFRQSASPDLVERVLTFLKSITAVTTRGSLMAMEVDSAADKSVLMGDNQDTNNNESCQYIMEKQWEVLIITK